MKSRKSQDIIFKHTNTSSRGVNETQINKFLLTQFSYNYNIQYS